MDRPELKSLHPVMAVWSQAAISVPFQRRFSTSSVLAATFDTSLEPRGEVVIVMHGDGPEEMEITLINCQADKSDEAACHHIP
jgi:hypothetical protein